MRKLFLTITILLLTQCKYTGGYDIVKGSKAISEIKKKITNSSFLGIIASASGSFSCPSTSNAKIVTETEPNNTFKYANKFDFLSATQSTRIQGTISTGNSDYDYFYMVVPSDTTYTKVYYKAQNTKGGGCEIDINSDGSELSNDSRTYNSKVTRSEPDASNDKTQSTSIKPGDYFFLKCSSGSSNAYYDIELSLTDIGSSSTVSYASVNSIFTTPEYLLSSAVFGPTVYEISAGISKDKYYTQASLDDCLKKLNTTVPLASLLDSYNLKLYIACGAKSYTPVNPYFVAGWQCKLQEAGWIQIGDLGIP